MKLAIPGEGHQFTYCECSCPALGKGSLTGGTRRSSAAVLSCKPPFADGFYSVVCTGR